MPATVFEGEVHPLTGNGNADICLESPNWSEYTAIFSYKEHLYKDQILNPPKFKDHKY